MTHPAAGIYLIVEFEWPRPFSQEHARRARQLHDVVQDKDWISEIAAASGGIGGGPGYFWIFWLPNYAALDRLLHAQEDPVHQAYVAFFGDMTAVQDRIREQVAFL